MQLVHTLRKGEKLPASWAHILHGKLEHAVLQAAEFLQPLLSSLDPPLVFEAAKGLLALGALSSTQSPSVALPTWAPLAVSALVELWDKAAHVPAGSQLLQIIVNHLPQLQVGLHMLCSGTMQTNQRTPFLLWTVSGMGQHDDLHVLHHLRALLECPSAPGSCALTR